MTEAAWGSTAGGWRSLAVRALHWWLSELSGLLSNRIADKFKTWTDRPLRLAFSEHQASLHVPSRARLPVEITALDVEGGRPVIPPHMHLGGAYVDVCFDESLVFRCVVELPLAAEDRLEPILRNQLGLLLPMDPVALRFIWQVIERKTAVNRLMVEVCLVKRATIDKAVAFSLAAGLVPESVVVTIDGQRTFKIWRRTDTRRSMAREEFHRRGLEVLSGVFAVSAYALLVWHLNMREAALQDLVSNGRASAAAASAIRERAESAERALAQARTRLTAPSPLTVLDALTKALPLDASVSEFHLQRGQVDIIGTASHATALLSDIEKTPLFASPSFEAPITTASAGTGERFDLRFRVRGAADP